MTVDVFRMVETFRIFNCTLRGAHHDENLAHVTCPTLSSVDGQG